MKVEKLDIMVRLAGESNVDALLSELKEYVSIHSDQSQLMTVFQICLGGRCRFRSQKCQSNWTNGDQDR